MGVTQLKSLDLLKAKKCEPDSGMIAPLDIQKVIPDKPRQEDRQSCTTRVMFKKNDCFALIIGIFIWADSRLAVSLTSEKTLVNFLAIFPRI